MAFFFCYSVLNKLVAKLDKRRLSQKNPGNIRARRRIPSVHSTFSPPKNAPKWTLSAECTTPSVRSPVARHPTEATPELSSSGVHTEDSSFTTPTVHDLHRSGRQNLLTRIQCHDIIDNRRTDESISLSESSTDSSD